MNFLLAGLSLLLMSFVPFLDGIFLQIFITNGILGITNLCAVGFLDGHAALRAMLGVPDGWTVKDQLQIICGRKKIHCAREINSQVMRIVVLLLLIFKACFVFLLIYELWCIFI